MILLGTWSQIGDPFRYIDNTCIKYQDQPAWSPWSFFVSLSFWPMYSLLTLSSFLQMPNLILSFYAKTFTESYKTHCYCFIEKKNNICNQPKYESPIWVYRYLHHARDPNSTPDQFNHIKGKFCLQDFIPCQGHISIILHCIVIFFGRCKFLQI